MKQFLILTSSILFIIFFVLVVILSTTGYETNKFNKLITEQIEKKNNKISLKLEKIKFKLDIKNFSLYLQTADPSIEFKELQIPVRELKVYLNLFSMTNSKSKISKVNLTSKEIDIKDLKKIILKTKPSNLNSFITNRVIKGKVLSEIEIYFDENQKIDNFISKGEVSEMEVILENNLKLENTKFTFFADSTDVLIKNINSKSNGLFISEGNLQLERGETTNLKTDFKTRIEINEKNLSNYAKFSKNLTHINKNLKINANLNHFLEISFDKTFKVIKYNYKNRGKVNNSSIEFQKPIKLDFLKKDINIIHLQNSAIKTELSPIKRIFESSGNYSFDKTSFQKYEIIHDKKQKFVNMDLNFDFIDYIKIDFINYVKNQNETSNIKLNVDIKNDLIDIKSFKYKEKNNIINIEGLKIQKKNIINLKSLEVKTFSKNTLKNDFKLIFNKQIKILGKRYDGTSLNKFLNKKSKKNVFKNITKDIEIDLQNIDTALSKKLSNFKLIGNIENGKFIKISSKGEFEENKFLDISMTSDKKSKKKFLEIYSDIPQPLLTEYSFFEGLSDGVLTFSSIIDGENSFSKIVIEDFKLVNAPGVVKLLSLADFGGLADLAEGDGLTFERMEINMINDNGFLKLEELYAVGPSVSVLMEGYRDINGLTSLRGTLVPAKNLNKLLSKIPVIGKIIIPKEIGEGLFGVSFKMKGIPGKIKTTINPIKTLTPRFITKALEKSKESN